ncbi:ribose ABC transporter permease [Mycobacterium sp. AT1]|nr:ribose ABC transporter permease [Mycobacterium sp. AT1]
MRRLAKSPLFPIIAALILACVVMFILTPNFLTTSNLTNIVTQSSIVGIAAVGATFIIITGGIDLSVGSNVALSGMVAATLVSSGLNGFIGVLVAIVVATAVGAFNGASVTALRLAPFIVTLAVLGMGRGLTLQISGGQSVYGLPTSFTWLGGGTVAGIPVPVIMTVVVFAVGYFVLSRTTFGHQVYAVGGNREAARLAGIRDRRVLFTVYAIAGLCAGIAAITLVGRLGSATPTAATGLELQVIAAVVIGGTSLFGGKGSLAGTFVGVLLIGVINNGLTLLDVSPFWVQFMQGLLIFLAVLLDSYNSRRLAKAKR